MSRLNEIYNSSNPNIILTPKNGWYEMRLADDLPIENALTIAILFSDFNEWGYWDSDPVTGNPIWVGIDVPEQNRALVKSEQPNTSDER